MKLKTPVGSEDHVQGPSDAPVTLVEYGDYQCAYCGQAYPIIKAIQERFGARLRFVFRNMPLTNAHPQAELAAEAAALQGKFWEMHDLLYEHQRELGPEFVRNAAARLQLDLDAFSSAIEAGKVRARVHHDFMDGVRSGVNGPPTFFINDERFDDAWDGSAWIHWLRLRIDWPAATWIDGDSRVPDCPGIGDDSGFRSAAGRVYPCRGGANDSLARGL
jgi:protein-disulfide isomerase